MNDWTDILIIATAAIGALLLTGETHTALPHLLTANGAWPTLWLR